jgi:hypothetical protein
MEGQNPYQPPAIIDAGPPGPPGMGPSEYEFDERENRTIARTAKLAKLWGVFALIVGALLLIVIGIVLAVAEDLAYELGADPRLIIGVAAGLAPLVIVDLVIGGLYIASGGSLRAVVDTAGDDVPLLMSGLNRLANAFRIEAIVTLVALVAGFIIGLVLSTSGEVPTWTP